MSNDNQLVRITRDDDRRETGNLSWHLVDPANPQGPAALCTGEFFGPGESDVEYETKSAKRGGITCPRCLSIIRTYKAVRL